MQLFYKQNQFVYKLHLFFMKNYINHISDENVKKKQAKSAGLNIDADE